MSGRGIIGYGIEVTKVTDLLSLIRVFGIDPYTAILDAGQICVQEKHEQETGFEKNRVVDRKM
jgi:hypothetical protein